MLRAWPYVRESDRERALPRFDHEYAFNRRHGEIEGQTPMERLAQDLVNNLIGN